MPIPKNFLDDLIGRTDITDVVGSYVRLNKKSGSNMFGLCPFHSEKTPSFAVNPDKQICHCFGCGKGGSAINFIMEIENLSFSDAVEFLAKRAGLTVPESDGSEELAAKRRRMLEINRDAARHFYEMLQSPSGTTARSYLAERGLSKAIVTRFGIGAAPDSWTLLIDAMKKKGYTKQELIEVGLARSGKEEGGAYDMFRNRLMFPIIDVRGSVIGFSGRQLGEGNPKYINSTDTIVFNKRRNLFGLNFAKKTKSGMLILAEGNIDVVSLHQAGFDCAVASLGTSLTEEQARLMSRYTGLTVIAYDADEAGREAALRAIPLLEKTGMGVKVIYMGDSKDPDEYLKKHGAEGFKRLLERSENHIEYRLAVIKNKTDMSTDEGRLSYIAAAAELISWLKTQPEREVYGSRVAAEANVSPGSVYNEIEKKIRVRYYNQKKEQEKRIMSPAAAIQPSDRTLKYKNEYSAAAEEGLVMALMRDPSLMKTVTETGFSQEEFTSPFLGKVFQLISGRISEDRDTNAALIATELEKNEASQLAALLQKTEALPKNEKTIRDHIEKIRTEKYKTVNPDSELLLQIKSYKEKKDIGGN